MKLVNAIYVSVVFLDRAMPVLPDGSKNETDVFYFFTST